MDELIVSNETKAFYAQLEDATQQIEALPKSGDEGLCTLLSQGTEQLTRVSEQYQKSQKAAEASLERAKTIHDQEVKFGHKKQAILDTKEGLLDTSQAVYELSETQKMLQSYQTYLTKLTGKLFELSVSSIAMSDSVVQRLQILLQGDKDGKQKAQLDDLAKKEVERVIRQIKNQESIMSRQSRANDEIRKNRSDIEVIREDLRENRIVNILQDEQIREQAAKDAEHDEVLAAQAEKDAEHDRAITAQAEKDVEHDRAIAAQAEKDIEHDRAIAAQAEKDAEHDRALAERLAKDVEQDEVLAAQAEKDAEHDRAIAAQADKDAEHDKRIALQEQELRTVHAELHELENEYKRKSKRSTCIIVVLFVIVLLLAVLFALLGTGVLKTSHMQTADVLFPGKAGLCIGTCNLFN